MGVINESFKYSLSSTSSFFVFVSGSKILANAAIHECDVDGYYSNKFSTCSRKNCKTSANFSVRQRWIDWVMIMMMMSDCDGDDENASNLHKDMWRQTIWQHCCKQNDLIMMIMIMMIMTIIAMKLILISVAANLLFVILLDTIPV